VWPTFVQRGVREPRLLEAGLDADTPFNVGASDGVLANLGLGAIGEDGLVCSVGTSLALRAGRREPFTDAAARPFCYVLDRDRFIVGGASNSGGLILDWLGRVAVNAESTLREAGIGRLLAEAAGVETGTLVCLPYVAGERAPLWDASVRAAFVGIDAAHGPAHLVRAAVEGILLNARWMRDATLRAATPRTVTVNGRLFEHAWVRQLAADTFGLPVVHPETLDASLVGAARLARVATLDAGWSEVVKSDDERGELVGVSSRAGEALARYERFRRLGEMASTLLAPSRGGRSGGVPVIGPAAV
jgi:gluconokinase